jgi:hypothetical protein
MLSIVRCAKSIALSGDGEKGTDIFVTMPHSIIYATCYYLNHLAISNDVLCKEYDAKSERKKTARDASFK